MNIKLFLFLFLFIGISVFSLPQKNHLKQFDRVQDLDDVFEFNTDIESNFNAITANSDQPLDFQLHQNYPNPFNPSTTIGFSIPEPAHVKIVVYNLLGQKVNVLSDKLMYPGTHTVMWEGKNMYYRAVSSGTYFYVIRAGEFTEIKKMVLIR